MIHFYSRITATIIALFFNVVYGYAQIPNAGFENWNSVGFPSYLDPAGWGTLNGSTNIIGIRTIERASGADVYSGTYALKASSKFISFANQTAPGITATGTINTNTQAIEGGFPYNQRPSQLRGWYKYSPANGDTAVVEVSLYKWNNSTGQRITVAEGSMKNPATVSSYTHFIIPLTYYTNDVPDTGRIILFSSASNSPQDGSAAFYDELSFFTCNVTASTSSTNATCFAANGTATLQFNTSNSQPITYIWSNGDSTSTITAASGSYSVTATDGDGCSVSASVTIASVNTNLNASASATTSSCNTPTGTATASTTNGTAPFAYLWSNGDDSSSIVNVGPATYQVTISDANGCTGSASTSVNTPNGPTATAIGIPVTCNGGSSGSVNLSVTGGTAPITYLWSNSATTEDLNNVSSNNYSVTVNDANGCSFVTSALVTEPTALSLSMTSTDATSSTSNNGTATPSVNGGTAPYNYLWNNGSTAASIAGLAPGSYCVTVTDFNQCLTSACAVVSAPSSIHLIQDVQFQIWPNPASGGIYLQTQVKGNFICSLVSYDGRVLNESTFEGTNYYIECTGFADGFYLLQLKDKNNNLLFRKPVCIRKD